MCNALIIEDNDKKIDELTDALNRKKDHIEDIEFNIFPNESESSTFSSKIKQLATPDKLDDLYKYIKDYVEEKSISVIILDFYLDGNNYSNPINRTDGYLLLKKIREGNDKFSKIPIYSFTHGEESLKKDENLITSGKIQGSIPKSENIYDDIANQTLYNMQYECKKYNNIQYADIVVITALKKELKPIIELLENKDKNEETSAIGYIKDKNNKKLKVVAATEERMGMAEAATLTTNMIIKYNPKFVVMTGIAAGIDNNFLDILIPRDIFNWQSGKYKVIKGEKKIESKLHVFDRKFSPQKTHVESNINIPDKFVEIPKLFLKEQGLSNYDKESIKSFFENIKSKPKNERNEFEKELSNMYQSKKEFLENKLEQLKKEKKDTNHIKKELEDLNEHNVIFNFIDNIVNNLECKIYKDGMVSGSAVVADEKIVEKHIDQRKVDGIDMEAYGVAYASNHSETTPKVLIIKAISDFANEEKNDIYQAMASYVSAQVFYEIFTKHIDF